MAMYLQWVLVDIYGHRDASVGWRNNYYQNTRLTDWAEKVHSLYSGLFWVRLKGSERAVPINWDAEFFGEAD